MRTSPLALVVCVAAASVNCWADEAPQPQPLMSGGPLSAIKAKAGSRPQLAVSPTVSQTTVVRMPDGSLGIVCEQKRNPRAAVTSPKTAAVERQQ